MHPHVHSNTHIEKISDKFIDRVWVALYAAYTPATNRLGLFRAYIHGKIYLAFDLACLLMRSSQGASNSTPDVLHRWADRPISPWSLDLANSSAELDNVVIQFLFIFLLWSQWAHREDPTAKQVWNGEKNSFPSRLCCADTGCFRACHVTCMVVIPFRFWS